MWFLGEAGEAHAPGLSLLQSIMCQPHAHGMIADWVNHEEKAIKPQLHHRGIPHDEG